MAPAGLGTNTVPARQTADANAAARRERVNTGALTSS
jgi:hypothetical protein